MNATSIIRNSTACSQLAVSPACARCATAPFGKILIADDDARIRAVVRALVEDMAEEIFEAGNGLDVLEAYLRRRPDWITLDLAMSPVGGFTVLREIMARDPRAKVIVVTAYDVPAFRAAARLNNARGYILKDDLSQLRGVLAGNTPPD